MLLVKNLKEERYLVLNDPIFRNFALILIVHFVISTGVDFACPLYVKDIYMEKMVKCLRAKYVYLRVQPQGVFILN